MAQQEVDRLITQQELVQLTGLSSAYFEQARHKGNSNLVFLKFGRAVRYRMSDVQSWIESNVIASGI
jgi:predicted DNA-binding transcriptional regulator AlpA